MAQIPTAWGNCGVVWKNHQSEQNVAFESQPTRCLLSRIILAGLSTPDLRRQLQVRHPGCREVFGDGHGNFHPEVVPEWFPQLVRYLQGYYSNGLRDWTEPQVVANWAFWKPRLDWSAVTPFQREVLEVTAAIGRGFCLTYGQVAAKVGKPKAGRAVGAALGSNPWPMLVPCHRVVGGTGKLTGFSAPGGVEAKRRMLDLEKPAGLFD
jgi:methylated-DNA-[protein]-cysteine S-methyltransferase